MSFPPRPDLQELVAKWGGYHRMPGEAWTEWDEQCAEYHAARRREILEERARGNKTPRCNGRRQLQHQHKTPRSLHPRASPSCGGATAGSPPPSGTKIKPAGQFGTAPSTGWPSIGPMRGGSRQIFLSRSNQRKELTNRKRNLNLNRKVRKTLNYLKGAQTCASVKNIRHHGSTS